MRTFETEYQLQQWRDIEGQHFDEDGDAYKGQTMARSTQEQMYDLINQLDSELTLMEQKLSDEKELLKLMNRMCVESLPPHEFIKWERVKDCLILARKNLKQ